MSVPNGPKALDEPTPEEIAVVVVKLSAGEWKEFTQRETDVAKWIVGWDDDITDVEEGSRDDRR